MKKTKVLVFAALLTGGVCMQAQEAALPKQIKIGKERVKARRELRLPEIDGYQLLKCDFHVHTIFSDGIVWPTLRVQEAWEEGLDAIAITDHIEGQPARQHVGKGHNNAFDMAKEEAARRNIILVKGGEITRSMPPGHLNALFVEDVDALDQPDYMKAIEAAHKQGAFIQWNHPGWGVDSIMWHDVHEDLYRKGWLNGIEVYNELMVSRRARLGEREGFDAVRQHRRARRGRTPLRLPADRPPPHDLGPVERPHLRWHQRGPVRPADAGLFLRHADGPRRAAAESIRGLPPGVSRLLFDRQASLPADREHLRSPLPPLQDGSGGCRISRPDRDTGREDRLGRAAFG